MTVEKVQECLYNYFLNILERDKLISMYGDSKISITTKYSQEMSTHSNVKVSGTENEAIRKAEISARLKQVEKKIYYIDHYSDGLTDLERKIVKYIQCNTKISTLSRMLGMDRRKVTKIRNSAIEKMAEWITDDEKRAQ